jgi:GNAT superfamily N-acetyltransferase
MVRHFTVNWRLKSHQEGKSTSAHAMAHLKICVRLVANILREYSSESRISYVHPTRAVPLRCRVRSFRSHGAADMICLTSLQIHRYGSWFNPFLYIRAVYTVPEYRKRSVFRALYQSAERIARSQKITEIIMHALCAATTPLEVPETVGLKRQVGIFTQTLSEYAKSLPKILGKYAERWSQWAARDAIDGEASYLVAGLTDIYHLEGYADQTDDMSTELQQAETFVREKRAIIAFDRSTNERLGLLTYAIGDGFPYGCGEFGKFSEKYLWCSYVWIEPKMRSSGVARFGFSFS